MRDLAKEYTIIIVTHNMQQAARVSDFTAFFSLSEDGKRAGVLPHTLCAKLGPSGSSTSPAGEPRGG